MYRIVLCIIALLIVNTPLRAQPGKTDTMVVPEGSVYRHYTGTIGNHKAVLDLRYGFPEYENFGGSTCYFTDEGGLDFFLIARPSLGARITRLSGQVFPENIPLSEIKDAYSIFVQTDRFDCKLSNDSLVGKWFVPNTQNQLSVALKEDYSSAVPFIFQHASDSVTATGRGNDIVKAVVSYNGVAISPRVKKKDAAFIYDAVAQFIGGSKSVVKDPYDLSQAYFQKFFADFKSSVSEGKKMDGNNFSGIYTLFPVYNDNGFLVLQKGGYQYDFENKEYTDRYLYLCLDVKNKKTLKLDDVLVVNNDAISALLEKAFRKKYQVPPDKKLNDLFITDKMPLTNNFLVVNKGLIFSYSPVKIFRDDQDISDLQEMRLFLSYDELGSMLQPGFKNRIGIK